MLLASRISSAHCSSFEASSVASIRFRTARGTVLKRRFISRSTKERAVSSRPASKNLSPAVLRSQKVSELMRRLHTLEGKDERQLALEIERLNSQLDRVQQQLYGRSSEKRKSPRDSQEGTDEAESAERTRTGHGPRNQPNLPVKEQVHDLDEADKTCPKCGGGLAR